jgi:hypothetical protein
MDNGTGLPGPPPPLSAGTSTSSASGGMGMGLGLGGAEDHHIPSHLAAAAGQHQQVGKPAPLLDTGSCKGMEVWKNRRQAIDCVMSCKSRHGGDGGTD